MHLQTFWHRLQWLHGRLRYVLPCNPDAARWGSQAVHFQHGYIHATECSGSAANRTSIHLVVHLRHEVVERASLAHELKGAQVKAGQNGVALAARGCVGAMGCCGLASAHRCDCANCRSGAGCQSYSHVPATGAGGTSRRYTMSMYCGKPAQHREQHAQHKHVIEMIMCAARQDTW